MVEQQRYVFTLIRERKNPTSFRIEARLYGIKTFSTYSSEEDIKEGSEYEQLLLDEMLRKNKKYEEFAVSLVASRIARLIQGSPNNAKIVTDSLPSLFEQIGEDKFAVNQTSYILIKYENGSRPYFQKLDQELKGYAGLNAADRKSIISSLSNNSYPLIEKTNIYLFYKTWADGGDLAEAASRIKLESEQFVEGKKNKKYAEVFGHFSGDMLAQLLRDTNHTSFCSMEFDFAFYIFVR
jgi:hypothetical protein